MLARIGINELTPNLLVILMIAVIAAFFSGLTVGRQMVLNELNQAVISPGVIEPAPPSDGAGGGVIYPEQPPDQIDGGGVACTMEAMACPDGTYVGRTGPNCEFSPCPGN